LEHGYHPGGFLTAVLCNDLKEACVCADEDSARALRDVVVWLHNYAPPICYGSSDRVEGWICMQGERARTYSQDKGLAKIGIERRGGTLKVLGSSTEAVNGGAS